MVRFILNLRSDSVKNKELLKVDVLNVPDRVKQLKMNHVFKIKKQTCPLYILTDSTQTTTECLQEHQQRTSLFLGFMVKELTHFSSQLSKNGTPYPMILKLLMKKTALRVS